ncbi:MAG: hypothetical protein EXR72_16190 [Myxococcales bacterium]|nr:hypothetical protein [Myxococcales bacterium]
MSSTRGRLLLGLSLGGSYSRSGHEEPAAGAGEAPGWHDLRLFFGELRLRAELGLTDWLAADLVMGLRMVVVGFQFQDQQRLAVETPHEDIHHRSETLIGPSDPWLSLRATRRHEAWTSSVRLGATLPIGGTTPNPFRLGRQGEVHQHIQFGTGTVNPLAEIEVRREVGRFVLSGWAIGKLALYSNRHGYQAGDLLLGGLRASSDLWLKRVRFLVGGVAYHEEAERWDGVVETEGNLGRTDVMVESAITWRFSGEWSVALSARLPVWSRSVGAQLSTPAVVELAIERPLKLF